MGIKVGSRRSRLSGASRWRGFGERSRWVKAKVRQHLAGAPLRQLRRRQLEMLQMLRQAQVERRREGP
jgi:hypothetical protein